MELPKSTTYNQLIKTIAWVQCKKGVFVVMRVELYLLEFTNRKPLQEVENYWIYGHGFDWNGWIIVWWPLPWRTCLNSWEHYMDCARLILKLIIYCGTKVFVCFVDVAVEYLCGYDLFCVELVHCWSGCLYFLIIVDPINRRILLWIFITIVGGDSLLFAVKICRFVMCWRDELCVCNFHESFFENMSVKNGIGLNINIATKAPVKGKCKWRQSVHKSIWKINKRN